MLAKALDCQSIPEEVEVPYPHTDLLERDLETLITFDFVNFILSGCKEFLTNEVPSTSLISHHSSEYSQKGFEKKSNLFVILLVGINLVFIGFELYRTLK